MNFLYAKRPSPGWIVKHLRLSTRDCVKSLLNSKAETFKINDGIAAWE